MPPAMASASTALLAASSQLDASSPNQSPRVAWLHVPKTGTSFATTLMHYANSSLPDDAHANSGGPAGSGSCDPSVTDECVDFSHSEIHATTFLVDYPASVWFNGAFPTSAMTRPVQNRTDHAGAQRRSWFGDHYSFGAPGDSPLYDEFKGHLFAMFRDPSRRLVSDYSRAMGNWNHDNQRREYPSASWDDPFQPPADALSLEQYARRFEGLAVRMLATSTHCEDGTARATETCTDMPSGALEVARTRLRDGFAFVGDTDDWEASICLFHLKLGGRCLDVELINNRPTAGSNSIQAERDSAKTVSDIRARFTDRYDSVLYADARQRFERDLQTYGVNAESCAAIGCALSSDVSALRAQMEEQLIQDD